MRQLELKKIKIIRFGILSPETIRKLAVARIITADTYNEDGTPIESGLMDRRLGTIEPGQRCRTCGNQVGDCSGHFGLIELARPVIHVGYAKSIIYKLLRAVCRNCSRLLLEPEEIAYYKDLIYKELDETGNISETIVKEVVKQARKRQTKNCPHCQEMQYKIKYEKPTTFFEETPVGSVRLMPTEIQERFERIGEDALLLLGINAKYVRPEWMILNVLPVPPVSVRASITLESGVRSEDDLTHKLVDIIRINQRLHENIEAGAPQLIVEDLWELLQYHITTYIDNEVAGIPPARHRSGRALRTITQRLRGKEGRFRGNLSGKRVDFSARTVISPDPNISINEVGIPEQVAKILTVPERVTEWNIEEMKELVMHGPEAHPGANYIIRPDGKRVDLRFVGDLTSIAENIDQGYTVERHLRDGDIVLFNRQPSLHRMSIMAHEVRVMPKKTFRLHLCVCIAPQTKIFTDYGKIPIEDIVENEETRFAPLSSDKHGNTYFSGVKRHYKVNPRELGLKCYRIMTENGRVIEASEEHPFYVDDFPVKVKDLNIGDSISIYPINPPDFEICGMVILTRDQIMDVMPEKAYQEYIFKELRKIGLLDIPSSSKKQITLASLVGHLYGDGSLLISYEGGRVIFRCRELSDAEKLCHIIQSLGLKPNKIKEFESKGIHPITSVNGKKNFAKGKAFIIEVRRKPIAIAFKALGVPDGDKTIKRYGVPEWILNGSKMVKRAFLRAYFGSEMSTPRLDRNPKRFKQLVVKFFKTEDVSFEPLAKDLIKLLSDFNIEVAPLRIEKGNIRKKDGKKTRGCVITLVATDENFYRFFRDIGFDFAKNKEIYSRYATEYLRLKINTKAVTTAKLNRAKGMRNTGINYEQISEEIGIPIDTISAWLSRGYSRAGLPSEFPNFEEWKEFNISTLSNGFILDRIKSIEEVNCDYVFDITTNDDNHNFIAEEFLTKNCTPYNADFDGDEMNVHVPQSEEARAETRVLMRVQEQILSPRYGGPIIGAIHDYVSAAFLLTQKNTLLTKEYAWQLLLAGRYEKELPPPAIEYPVERWTGKQIISLLLPEDVTMTSRARVCKKEAVCRKEGCIYDAYVVIVDGELLAGSIDRRAIGADESESVLHRVVKDHGADEARKFIDSLTQLLLEYLTHIGFSLGFSTVEIDQEAKDRIDKIIDDAEKKVNEYIEMYKIGGLEHQPGKTPRETLESKIMGELATARDSAGRVTQEYLGLTNSAVIMAVTGARGSQLNISQMTACVGQQAIRGKRILRGYRNRALPHFREDEMGSFARGFVKANYRSGLNPIEFFFHAQGGREGLVDTAVRTSTSGYLQRRLVNALQDLQVSYDGAVRTAEGKIVQFKYGEDGVDPMKSYHGKPVDIDSILAERGFGTRKKKKLVHE